MTDAPVSGSTVTCQQVVELVTDYLEGELEQDLAAEIEAHLALCAGCATYLEQMRTTIGALGRVPVESLSAEAQAELVRVFRAGLG